MRTFGISALLYGLACFIFGWWLIYHARYGIVSSDQWAHDDAAGSAMLISGTLSMLAGGYALARRQP